MLLKSTLAAGALALSLIGFGATTNTASAADGYTAGVYLGFSSPAVRAVVPVNTHAPRYRYHRYRSWRPARLHRHCQPVYAKRRAFVPGRGWTRATVKVGTRCYHGAR